MCYTAFAFFLLHLRDEEKPLKRKISKESADNLFLKIHNSQKYFADGSKEVLMADFSENDDDICEMIVDDESEW